MKKIMIAALVVSIAIFAGGCIYGRLNVRETLSSVTYCSHHGYSLSMTAGDDFITVIYEEEGREPVSKKTDISCYENMKNILEEYDFSSWRGLSDGGADKNGFDTLKICYDEGSEYFFSSSQTLPENALEAFKVINSCLMEYAGIVK